ncbi:MAG: uracil-DNA glycosylase [Planctomycetota bacterium]
MPEPDAEPDTDAVIRRAVLQQLTALHAAGVGQLPTAAKLPAAGRSSVRVAVPAAGLPAAAPPAASEPALPARQEPTGGLFPAEAVDSAPAGGGSGGSSAATLEVLRQQVAGCTLCGELAATRQNTVFGVGAPDARLCFLGEAPGADEDRLGEPFVGRAGQLLDKIIVACRLRREEVYIVNILKCRPPGNRNPTPEESGNCKRYLTRQLDLIRPEFLCCLGAVAAQNLLDTKAPIGRLRGKTHDYRGIKVVCTYHPAYLLRNPAAKKDTWADMKMLMRLMGVEL